MTIFEWLIFFLVVQVIHGLGTWKLYVKSGYNSELAFIPVYNAVILMKIINRPTWWVILLFLPIINLLIFPVIWVETARSFGKNTTLDTIAAVASLGFFIYLINYSSKSEYISERDINPKTAFGEWLGSIIFAVILATFVHTYLIQPYIVPTGSLEKSILIGDFLFVSKFHYGARAPQTAVSFPMVHDTIVGTGIRSYLNKPQIPYFRLPGFQKIKRNEIVTFSWPADTVRKFFVREKGVKKPIDKKSNYVKRCVALPSDTLEIINGLIHINGKKSIMPYRAKPIYTYSAYNSKGVSASNLIKLGVSDIQRKFKIQEINQYKFEQIRPYLLNVIDNSPENFIVITKSKGIPYEIRLNSRISMTEIKDTKTDLFLTNKEADLISKSNILDSLKRTFNEIKSYNTSYFPNDIRFNWNEDNFGPIIIPKTNTTVELSKNNLPIYKKIIREYEKNELTLDLNGTIRINNIETNSYTFKQDYYWMMGDNRQSSLDARFWGFTPMDHVVGKPVFIWMSFKNGMPWSGGKPRWERFFTTVHGSGNPVSYLYYFLGLLGVWIVYSNFIKKKKKP